MSLNPDYVISSLSTIGQVVSTILSIYLVVFIFSVEYLLRERRVKRNTNKKRKQINLVFIAANLLIIFLAYRFIFPSLETMMNYLFIIIIFLYNLIIITLFNFKKNYKYIELGTLIFSSIFALFSFYKGFMIIFESITPMVNVANISEDYFYSILIDFRFYLFITLISLSYLILIIFMHNVLIHKNKNN